SAAWAATISVTTTVDAVPGDGLCSLREAIVAANTNVPVDACAAGDPAATDTISLTSGSTYSLTIVGAGEDASATGDLDVTDDAGAAIDVIIAVSGGGTATIQQAATPGDRVLSVLTGATVEVTGVTFTGGGNVSQGGGIFNQGSLTLVGCAISTNSAALGGGIANEGSLTLTGTSLVEDTATTEGGGVWDT